MANIVRRVLVTGGSGFIGSASIPRLAARGFDVHAVSSRPVQTRGAHWHQCDLLNPTQCNDVIAEVKPTHLLHLAWIATPGQFWASPLNLQWLASSVALVDAFYRRGGTRALGVGSCAEYAWVAGDYSEETSKLAPDTVYGRCKHALGLAFIAAAAAYGGSSAWARLFFPYGPGEPPQRFIPSVIRGLLRGKPVECTAGTQVRDFVFVDDVADALVALLEAETAGAFNIGSGGATTLRDMASVIVGKLGHEDLLRFGTRASPPGDPAHVVADVTKLQRETQWQPLVSNEAGIGRTIAYWREQLAIEGTT